MTATTETAEQTAATTAEDAAALKAQLSELSEQVASLAHTVLADVPDAMRALIPDGLPPALQAAWVLKARQSGVFTKPVAATDTRKPTVTPTKPDLSSLPPIQRMAAGYKN